MKDSRAEKGTSEAEGQAAGAAEAAVDAEEQAAGEEFSRLSASDLTGALLRSVSRSFYLTIRWLPSAMRPGVALGYLLARATDSVADTSTASLALRLDVLEAMGKAVAGTLPTGEREALLTRLREEMAPAQEKASEAALLCRFGEALQALLALPSEQADCVRSVLATIVEGQRWDLSYFAKHRRVTDDGQTRTYTILVAGCVGKFWTELGRLTLGDAFCSAERLSLMTQAGIRYGQGLQLVNILRDREEDGARGREYLCSEPAVWRNRALRYLQDGLDYSRRLKLFRLRFASMLPALIGLKTLRLPEISGGEISRGEVPEGKISGEKMSGGEVPEGGMPGERGAGKKAKISRRQVYLCVLRALWLSARKPVF